MGIMQQKTLDDLARGLYEGTIKLDEIKISIPGDQIQDTEFAKFKVQQTLNEKHVRSLDVLVAVATYIERAWVEGVIEWRQKY